MMSMIHNVWFDKNEAGRKKSIFLSAFFVFGSLLASTAVAGAFVWNGAADGDWNAAANWNEGADGVPGAADNVSIPAGATALLSESSPQYASIDVYGTLVVSNWTTRLSATNVTVRSGGVITCGAASADKAGMSRVWIACSNLVIAANGSIDVSEKGYLGRPKSSGYGLGYGPGASKADHNVGPSHGGHGGFKFYNNTKCDALPYDDPFAPEEPGSSGTKSTWGKGGSGGGAVRIDASGEVVVNGRISANGEVSCAYNTTVNQHCSSGAGGSIFVTCRTISGSGMLSANGGGGDRPSYTYPAMAAGGGCIAVHYNTALQSAASVTGMKISAAAGLYATGTSSSSYKTTNVTADKDRAHADIGTLHFSDAKMLDALLGNGLTGQIRGISNYVYDGDLSFTFGHVRFAEEGVSFRVTGDLVMGGEDSRLEIGGCEATNCAAFVSLRAGVLPCTFSVGGNLTLGGTSRLDVRAAATNSTDVFGALTRVAGAMTIGAGCSVYAWSDPVVVSVPRFEVGGLYIAEGGLLSAYRRGGRAQLCYGSLASAYGANSSGTGCSGAGHGGRGGACYQGVGQGNDNANRPSLPGGGGGSFNNYCLGGDGGGIVSVSATNGTVRVNGEINADGESGCLLVENKNGAGGAGGTIFIEANKFIGGSTAVLSAKGGTTSPVSSVASGGGGGGRIAIWCGQQWTEDTSARRITISGTPLEGEKFAPFFEWAGTVSVDGGATLGDYANENNNGEDGTVRFCHVSMPPGVMITIW